MSKNQLLNKSLIESIKNLKEFYLLHINKDNCVECRWTWFTKFLENNEVIKTCQEAFQLYSSSIDTNLNKLFKIFNVWYRLSPQNEGFQRQG